jgi:peptidoglycan/LPS O-acetylase OafA/YrhL
MGLIFSIAFGIVLAVIILRFLPEILVYGSIGILLLVAAVVVITGILWLFYNPDHVLAILIFLVIILGPLFLEGWPIKRLPTEKEKETARRRSLGYEE